MNEKLNQLIETLELSTISEERKTILNKLVTFIQSKKDKGLPVNLNFICTHNSRRSHLSQIWAQTMAHKFKIANIFCYSGGTEATAMFPFVGDTLKKQGFEIHKLSNEENPVYAVKFAEDLLPIICFSKTFDANFNPKTNFAAVMTCSHADENCPFIAGAEQRIPVRYEDPKAYDNTPLQDEKYTERSLQIATEMKYIFSKIKS
ncbi:arsenate-mycothiol transferase ArsC [Winogradskyella haliclonae]|uniref:Arsenate reductase n=1 Tax=Winogradskyella haliclonae TaxID=2048558 RepID=A0ABQ2C1P3_9FLAO|nr:protein-tyrosine-phosphatase [Winogradskyella haliclonae]GGI57702.1 arsenate reductase [Winogradskyella haliclonae]